MKKNKNTIIVVLVVFVVLAITGFSLYLFLFSGMGGSPYGNRLDGIENVPITNETIEQANNLFESVEGVNKSTYTLNGKISYFVVMVDVGTNPETVKKVEDDFLELFTEEQIAFYDFQILIDDGQEESDLYPVMGSKSVNNEAFTWVGKVVSNEE